MTTDLRADFDAWLDYPSMIKGGRIAANWMADGRFWFTDGAPQNIEIHVFDPATDTVAPLFDKSRVREAYRASFGRDAAGNGLPFDAIRPAADGGFTVTIEGRDFALSPDGAVLTALPVPNMMDMAFGTSAALPETFTRPSFFTESFGNSPEMISPDGRWYVSIRDNDLWLRSRQHGRRERLTVDGEPQNGWDVESVRIGAGAGMQLIQLTTDPWAPSSQKLFVSRFDEREIAPMMRVRWNGRVDEVEASYSARAGERFPTAAPHILNIMSRQLVPLDVPLDNRILLLAGWSADSASVTFVQFATDMSWAGVWRADATTGEARLLLEERTDTFLRIQHEVIAGRSGCTLLPDGGFLWESARDGFDHLYHYDADGRLLRQLTGGDWPTIDVQAFDADNRLVYFTAHHDPMRPYDIHLCRVSLGEGEVEQLTEGTGVHEVQISPDRAYFIDTVSRPDLAPRSVLRRASGEEVHRFAEPDISALEAKGWIAPEQVVVKAADGETDLWALVYKPRGFDPTKSYPVLEYIYGGPQVSTTPHHFALAYSSMAALSNALPQLGYVVVVSDARGTPERSKAFLDVVYKDWRRHTTADHAAVIRNLAQDRPWMDLDRVGIYGHSWGGYFTVANMFDNPDLYRVGVASAPHFEPYDNFLYEPYLGGPPRPDNCAAYEDATLMNDAAKLKGDLMIVAGSNDIGVWQSSVRMSDALIHAGRQHELVMLPATHHGFGRVQEAYFIEKLVGHFDRFLKPPRLSA